MSNLTKMTDFKHALYMFTGFSREQTKSYTVIEDIDCSIKKLLSDKLMMKNKNKYTFDQRTSMTIIVLLKNTLKLAFSDHQEDREKAKELYHLIDGTSVSIAEQI